MRIKTFVAPTVALAMAEVRAAMGADAIIVASHNRGRGRGIEVTAAVESDIDDPLASSAGADSPAAQPLTRQETAEALARALAWHGVPQRLVERLSLAAAALDAADATLALAGALDASCRFDPLPVRPSRPLMLVGPNGAGKTVTCAKLAARAALTGSELRLVSTDTVRAGGIEQLSAYADVLDRPVAVAERPAELAAALHDRPDDATVLIDSPGTNPHNETEFADLRAFIEAARAEPILVLPAGMDAIEAAEAAAAFADLGVDRLIVTRLDAARRLGLLLAAAEGGSLALADVGLSPFVAEGLRPLNPVSLARLLVRDPAIAGRESVFCKVAD